MPPRAGVLSKVMPADKTQSTPNSGPSGIGLARVPEGFGAARVPPLLDVVIK